MTEEDIKHLTAEYEKKLRKLAESGGTEPRSFYELETSIEKEFQDSNASILAKAAEYEAKKSCKKKTARHAIKD